MNDSTKQEWECDGCLKVINVTDAELQEASCDCKGFWGWMLVGGPAWHDYHDKGIAPMNTLIGDVAAVAKKFGILDS